uniref:Ribosome assembly protein 3 n=1 Tax=Albugo laibachii Nc14 TaxID=890382 RepID=F0WVX3_9STRA|nr:conserved hypothetical protein [Albugo laibachii Nc14]|eukprot:CCA25574.1 conserved hypothetical protein [Albugo laibachii Nc14]
MEDNDARQDPFLRHYDEILQVLDKVTLDREDRDKDNDSRQGLGAMEVTDVTLECVKLLEKALALSDHYAHLEHQLNVEEDRDDIDIQEQTEDDATVSVLADLLRKSDEMKDKVSKIIQQRVQVRSDQTLKSTAKYITQSSHPNTIIQALPENREFTNLYVETFTNAFGDELDQFRHDSSFTKKDVSHLVSCIQMGADIFTDSQKEMLLFASSQ